MIMYWYGTSSLAGIRLAEGIFSTRLGLSIFHPAVRLTCGAASSALPSGLPSAAQFASVLICSSLSDESFEKCPQHGSANQGGMVRFEVAALIAAANGRVCSYVSKGMGAISPAR